MNQFDVIDVILNPTVGSEQFGTRPCVILQTNATSNLGKTTIIAPLSSKKITKIYPYEILIEPSKMNGLAVVSKIKLNQVRVIAHERIKKKRGKLEEIYFDPILEALDILFDREQMFL